MSAEKGEKMRLRDKVALITGSGDGIGRATAILFAKEGAKVVVNDVIPEKGEETVRMIREQGGEAAFVQADVSKLSDIRKLVAEAVRKYGRLNILMNNVGINEYWVLKKYGMAEEKRYAEEVWNLIMDTNLKGTFYCSLHAAPEIIKSGGGAVINVSSVSALSGTPELAIYAISKEGIACATKQLAMMFAPKVRVNCICPSVTLTPRIKGGYRDEEKVKAASKAHPLGRMGKPEDHAYAALYLASDEASWVTGVLLLVDGGRMLPIPGGLL
jgi:NAD(P)-dependent dehydrogenase (short-subunit alcohol dehydrogenase family)